MFDLIEEVTMAVGLSLTAAQKLTRNLGGGGLTFKGCELCQRAVVLKL